MGGRFFLLEGEQAVGPLSVEELAARVQQPRGVDPGIRICREGDRDWVALNSVPEFAFLFRPPPIPAREPLATGNKWAKALPWVIVFGLLMLSTKGWLGVLLGLGLVAYQITAFSKKLRSPFNPLDSTPVTIKGLILGILLGLFCFMLGGADLGAKERAEKAKVEQVKTAAVQAEAKEKARQQQVVRANSSVTTSLDTWRKELQQLTDAKADHSNVESLSQEAAKLLEQSSKLRKTVTDPEGSAQLDAFIQQLAPVSAGLKAGAELMKSVAASNELMEKAKGLISAQSWIEAETASQEARESLKKIETVDKAVSDRFLPGAKFNLVAKVATAEQYLRSVKAPAEKAKQKKIEEEAYAILCGPSPQPDSWDGEIPGLEYAIARTAHDPDSIDVENCTRPVLTTKRCWQFTCDVRGKNAFGALVLNVKTFYYSKIAGFEE